MNLEPLDKTALISGGAPEAGRLTEEAPTSHASAATAGSTVMEIACGSTPLTDAKKCSDERTAGSELEIIVNPTTQKGADQRHQK